MLLRIAGLPLTLATRFLPPARAWPCHGAGAFSFETYYSCLLLYVSFHVVDSGSGSGKVASAGLVLVLRVEYSEGEWRKEGSVAERMKLELTVPCIDR